MHRLQPTYQIQELNSVEYRKQMFDMRSIIYLYNTQQNLQELTANPIAPSPKMATVDPASTCAFFPSSTYNYKTKCSQVGIMYASLYTTPTQAESGFHDFQNNKFSNLSLKSKQSQIAYK